MIFNNECSFNNAALIKIAWNVTLRKAKGNLQEISGHWISLKDILRFMLLKSIKPNCFQEVNDYKFFEISSAFPSESVRDWESLCYQ